MNRESLCPAHRAAPEEIHFERIDVPSQTIC
jgi:hypothetical protein